MKLRNLNEEGKRRWMREINKKKDKKMERRGKKYIGKYGLKYELD
jgi:hypothetical protein